MRVVHLGLAFGVGAQLGEAIGLVIDTQRLGGLIEQGNVGWRPRSAPVALQQRALLGLQVRCGRREQVGAGPQVADDLLG